MVIEEHTDNNLLVTWVKVLKLPVVFQSFP